MNPFKWLFVLVSLCIGTEIFALDTEHVIWDKSPIHLNIPLNEERLIRFPLAVSIVDNEASDAIAILKVQDVIYVKAKEPFENKRLLVQLMPQGEVIILNLSAKKEISESKPVEVVLEKTDEENTNSESANSFDFNDITLTRFAIQSYTPPKDSW
jgi:integrating conjugative element protein (TIGR03749 family)